MSDVVMFSAPNEVIAAVEARAHIVRSGPAREQIVWRMFGSGPLLLLLHGGFGSWLHWLPVIGQLERNFCLAVPDMPGFGDSDPLPKGSMPELLADRLTIGIDELFQPNQDVCLAGFSFGGLVAAHVALRIGGRLGALGLVASSGLGEEREAIKLRKRSPGMLDSELAEIAAHNVRTLMLADPARADALAVEIQQRNTRRPSFVSRSFSRSRTVLDILPRLRAVVAAIWGTRDPTVGSYLDERVAGVRALAPYAVIAVLQGCGHWIMQERPDALALFLIDTMKRRNPTGDSRQ